MVLFAWNPKLETGITLVDEQHKEILKEVNAFYLRYKCGHRKEAVQGCLAFLQQYVQYHFQAEEAFQMECKYVYYARHAALHQELMTQLKFCTVKLESSCYSEQETKAFCLFLKRWLKHHLYEEDMHFAAAYNQYRAHK